MPNSFTSSDQAFGTGTTTLAHSLGARPALVKVMLVCQTAEYGFSAGDVVEPADFCSGITTNVGVATVRTDATNVYVRTAGNVPLLGKTAPWTGKVVTLTQANWKWRVYAQLADSNGVVTADQTITNQSSTTIAHGLGAIPLFAEIALVCQTAELGYSVGDVVHPICVSNADPSGCAIKMDATNLTLYMSNITVANFYIVHGSTAGQVSAITNGRWKLRIYAQRAHSTAGGTLSAGVNLTDGATIGTGAFPSTAAFVSYSLQCVNSADNGWSVGDICVPRNTNGSNQIGASIIRNGTGQTPVKDAGQVGAWHIVNTSTLANVKATTNTSPVRWSLRVYSQAAA